MEVATDIAANRSWRSTVLVITLCAVTLGTIVWANIWKTNLKVADVRVEGNHLVSASEILTLAKIQTAQKLFDVELTTACQRVLENKFMKSVSVNREVPNRIVISVVERIPMAAVVSDQLMYLDDEGCVLPPLKSTSIADLPVLTGVTERQVLIPGKAVTDIHLKQALRILSVARELDEDLVGRLSEIHLSGEKDIVLYTAEGGVPVIFGMGDIGRKLTKFNDFWKTFVHHHGARELAYVDLRFQDQVIVRWNHSNEANGEHGA